MYVWERKLKVAGRIGRDDAKESDRLQDLKFFTGPIKTLRFNGTSNKESKKEKKHSSAAGKLDNHIKWSFDLLYELEKKCQG